MTPHTPTLHPPLFHTQTETNPFTDTLIHGKHIPQKIPSSRHTLLWFSRDLGRHHKKWLYRHAHTSNTPENWPTFKSFQRTFSKNTKKEEHKQQTRHSHQKHQQHLWQTQNTTHPSNMFSHIKMSKHPNLSDSSYPLIPSLDI